MTLIYSTGGHVKGNFFPVIANLFNGNSSCRLCNVSLNQLQSCRLQCQFQFQIVWCQSQLQPCRLQLVLVVNCVVLILVCLQIVVLAKLICRLCTASFSCKLCAASLSCSLLDCNVTFSCRFVLCQSQVQSSRL